MQICNANRLYDGGVERFRLEHLTCQDRHALEEDLQRVIQAQRRLLPRMDIATGGWRTAYHYEPAGLVGGDYCDVVDAGRDGLYFMVGDACGKGVAASILMARLHAMFRTLISVAFPLSQMLERASQILGESTLAAQYATLIFGKAQPDGIVEICNAGHPLPFLVGNGEVTILEGSDFPLGLFSGVGFSVSEIALDPGQSLLLYSDGVCDAQNIFGQEYGARRLRETIRNQDATHPSALVAACRDDLAAFRRGAGAPDDITLFVLSRNIGCRPSH